MHGWTTKRSRVAYENRWIRVREDEITRPDGSDGIYGVVELRHDAVFVVAMTDADEVVLVRLYRYTTGMDALEVPAGGTEGDIPLDGARRELREETGLDADDWVHLGTVNAFNGVCDATEHVFLARGLREAGEHAREEEGITEVVRIPWTEALDLVRSGEIVDGETVTALMLAALHLGRVA